MTRAILIGDGQTELYNSLRRLITNVEPWQIEQTPHRAFLEDGTEYELFVGKGAYIKRIFSKKTDWKSDFPFSDARVISEQGARRQELRDLLIEGLAISGRLNSSEQKDHFTLEEVLIIFEERLGCIS